MNLFTVLFSLSLMNYTLRCVVKPRLHQGNCADEQHVAGNTLRLRERRALAEQQHSDTYRKLTPAFISPVVLLFIGVGLVSVRECLPSPNMAHERTWQRLSIVSRPTKRSVLQVYLYPSGVPRHDVIQVTLECRYRSPTQWQYRYRMTYSILW